MRARGEVRRAAETLLAERKVRIVVERSGDSLAGASLLGRALEREGISFHLTSARRITTDLLERVLGEKPRTSLLLGFSGDDPTILSRWPGTPILVEPALREEEIPGAIRVAPEEGGAGVSLAAYSLALSLSPRNSDLVPWALAGAWALFLRPFQGEAAAAAADGCERGHLIRVRGIPLGEGNLSEALTHSIDPFLPGVSGRARVVQKILRDSALPPDSPTTTLAVDPPSPPKEGASRLVSLLALQLLEEGRDPSGIVQPFFLTKGTPRLEDLGWGLESCASGLSPIAHIFSPPHLVEDSHRIRQELLSHLVKLERDLPQPSDGFVALSGSFGGLAPYVARIVASDLLPAPVRGVALRGPPDPTGEVEWEVQPSPRLENVDLVESVGEIARRLGGRARPRGVGVGVTLPVEGTQPFLDSLPSLFEGR